MILNDRKTADSSYLPSNFQTNQMKLIKMKKEWFCFRVLNKRGLLGEKCAFRWHYTFFISFPLSLTIIQHSITKTVKTFT